MGDPSVLIGQRLSNYEIVSILGQGGMGTVYLAHHVSIGRKAAVKVLRPDLASNEALVTRFINEARAANAIQHPNIIDIIDVGVIPGGEAPYLLMEFLEGESLASRLRYTRPLQVPVALDFAIQTASALAAAHSQGIVHRDLKPENLFLVPDPPLPSGERVKVLDFGIAKLQTELGGNVAKTQTGTIMGTGPYMSPEQCQGFSDLIDHRTDIYSLGIILYEMLCGAPPFVSEGFGNILVMHITKEPEPPRNLNPSISEGVEAAILRALAKNPADRFASMAEFATALFACNESTSLPTRQFAIPGSAPNSIPGFLPGTPAPTTGMRPGSPTGSVPGCLPGTPGSGPRSVPGYLPGSAPGPSTQLAAGATPLPRPPSRPPSTPPRRPVTSPSATAMFPDQPMVPPRTTTTLEAAAGQIDERDIQTVVTAKRRWKIIAGVAIGLAVAVTIIFAVRPWSSDGRATVEPPARPGRLTLPIVPPPRPATQPPEHVVPQHSPTPAVTDPLAADETESLAPVVQAPKVPSAPEKKAKTGKRPATTTSKPITPKSEPNDEIKMW